MFPVLPVDDDPCLGVGNAKTFGNLVVEHSCISAQSADRMNVGFGQLGAMMPGANYLSAMTDLIGLVFPGGRPSQIACAIIEVVSVPVGSLMPLRWGRAIKREAHCLMYRHRDAVKANEEVSGPVCWMKNGTFIEVAEKLTAFLSKLKPTVQRPHLSQARSLIARMARHWTPFFWFGYRMLSHIAPLQRLGQGVTEGCNQPSFPIYNRRVAGSISILAARV